MRLNPLRSRARVAARHFRKIAMSLEEAYRFVGLGSDTSPEEVKRKYRELAFQYHPDRGGSTELMQQLNAARETIEAGGVKPVYHTTAPAGYRDEGFWSDFADKYGPKASGNYGDADVQRFAREVLEKGFHQIIYRRVVQWVPITAGISQGDQWTYYAPFGSKTRTQRMFTDMTPEKLLEAIRSYGRGEIFDLVVKNREAWITWKLPGREGYQSLSFELVRAVPKKVPGVGMTREAIQIYLRNAGLTIMAGGTRFAYWATSDHHGKGGYFIREAAKTLRVVLRRQVYSYGGLDDVPLASEVFFGKVTPAMLDKWANYIKAKDRENEQ